jgi:dipeptidyl-peptidase-4
MKLFLFSCLILSYSSLLSQEITVDKIWKNYEFSSARVEGFRTMKDGVHYSKIERKGANQRIVKNHIENPTEQTILIAEEQATFAGKPLQIDDYEFNSNENMLLITTETEPIYRRSYKAIHYIFDLTKKTLVPLDTAHQPQTLAEFSPDGTQVAYIYKNDLFVKSITTGKVKKITSGGKLNKVINGSTDWVYEEEFSITKAYAWSPDSKYIAYLRFDEQEVKEFNMTYYNDLYPELYTYKYPKAGEKNSIVTAHIIQISSRRSVQLDLGDYEYIPRLKWSSTENKLILQTLNRHQNELKYHLVDVSGKKATIKEFYTEKAATYIDVDNNLHILGDGKTILRTSDIGGYNHIYALTTNGRIKQLTQGKWEVIDFLGYNESTQTIYFSAAITSAIDKGIYSISITGDNLKPITLETGTNDAEFTNGMGYFIHTYSTASAPPVYKLCKADGSVLQTLQDNQALNDRLKSYNLSEKVFFTIPNGDYPLNAWMIKPPQFDPSKKYPVFMTVYGGPGHNEVLNAWDGNDYFYHQLLAQKGYIVVSVDPRGTMYRGVAFKKSTYLQLGKYETEDIITTAKYLQEQPYVDPTRIGIQGWSFGGFMTSLAMTKGSDYFKMGIAVAPVTNWRYYDNIYTERFMRTPQENQKGYDENSPINFANQLKGKYLLIHGSGDDNVHYQNAMEMVNALVKANKQFDLFIYPNRNHGIYGGNTRNHLFQMMLNYTLENL